MLGQLLHAKHRVSLARESLVVLPHRTFSPGSRSDGTMQSLSSPCANTAIDRIVRSRDEHSSAGAAKILAHTLDKLPTNASSDCESTCARRYRFEARGGGAGVVAAVETDAPLLVDVVAVVVVVDDGSRQVWTRLDLRPVRMNAPIRWSSRTTEECFALEGHSSFVIRQSHGTNRHPTSTTPYPCAATRAGT